MAEEIPSGTVKDLSGLVKKVLLLFLSAAKYDIAERLVVCGMLAEITEPRGKKGRRR